MIIKAPRVTKPEDGDSSGQLLAMYRRNSPISVMIRPTRFKRQSDPKDISVSSNLLEIQAVIRWLTPSKKKNLLTTNVLTSITNDAARTERRHMMLQTRITLRTM